MQTTVSNKFWLDWNPVLGYTQTQNVIENKREICCPPCYLLQFSNINWWDSVRLSATANAAAWNMTKSLPLVLYKVAATPDTNELIQCFCNIHQAIAVNRAMPTSNKWINWGALQKKKNYRRPEINSFGFGGGSATGNWWWCRLIAQGTWKREIFLRFFFLLLHNIFYVFLVGCIMDINSRRESNAEST